MLLNADQVRRVLAEEGQDEALAEHRPQAIRWRAQFDKCSYLDVAPLSAAGRAALEAYLKRHPKVGKAWVFPANRDAPKALDKLMAGYGLEKAEKLAALPKMKRGVWHAFRRGWAQLRKHLPVQDVMAAGGWRDVRALQSAYQAADPDTVRTVGWSKGPDGTHLGHSRELSRSPPTSSWAPQTSNPYCLILRYSVRSPIPSISAARRRLPPSSWSAARMAARSRSSIVMPGR